MSILLIGMKGCGKTTVGHLLAERLQVSFFDSDTEIEKMHEQGKGEALPFRQIFRAYGAAYFQALDRRTLEHIAVSGGTDFVFACGGRTPLAEENQKILRTLGKIIFLNVEKRILLRRILAQGIPPFFAYPDDPERSLDELFTERWPIYKWLAERTVDIGEETAEQVVQTILTE